MTRRVFVQAGVVSLCVLDLRAQALRSMERQVFNAINFERAKEGAPALVWDDAIAAAARDQSTNEEERGFFAHIDPLRGDLATRLNAAGIPWMRCGENIFNENGYMDPVMIAVIEWRYSPGHRQNYLNPDFTHSGVGVAVSAKETYFVTQIFVTPPAPARRRP